MPFKFNPFTGNFDQTGSGGGGSSYLDGEVQNFSALPQTVGSPAVDSAYLVREAEGAWLISRKPAGIYIRTANTGTRASDWTYAGEFPDVFNDANLVVYNNTDSTKNVKFDASAIATGTTRTITVPDANITLDDAGDSRTPSSHSASHAAAGSDPLFDQDLNTTDDVVFGKVSVDPDLGPMEVTGTGLSYSGTQQWDVETGTFYDGDGAALDYKDDSVRLYKPLSFAGGDAATNASTTRTNLGLGDAATADSTDFAAATHASSHAATGSDPLFDQDLNTTDNVAFEGLRVVSAASQTVAKQVLVADDEGTIVGITGNEADARASLGLGDSSTADIGTGSTEVAAGDHGHGNITSDGKLGSTAGLPVVTTTAGAVTTLALGTANQVLKVNSGATGVEFADPAASGVTGAAASAADVLGVSGANITGVDANADRIVYWNNTSNKLAYGTPADAGAAAASHTHTSADINSQTASNGHVLTANGSGGSSFAALPASGISAVGASTADVLSVSGSDLVADDGGTIDSSDPFIKWDDVAGKLVYANPLSRPSGAFYVGLAPTTTALGTNSVNIQSGRDNAAHLAKDASSVCVGYGARSTSSSATAVGHNASCGNGAFAGGGNASCGNDAIAVGSGATAGNSGAALGRNANCSGGVNSVAIGNSIVTSLRAQFVVAPFAAVYWGGQTTTNAATILNLDATATNRFTIAANTALAVDILLVARRSDVADKWLVARRFLGIRRDGSNNTSLIGAVQTLGTDQSAGSPTWTFTLSSDDVNEALQLEVVGATGETVQWRASAIYRAV